MQGVAVTAPRGTFVRKAPSIARPPLAGPMLRTTAPRLVGWLSELWKVADGYGGPCAHLVCSVLLLLSFAFAAPEFVVVG